MSAVRKIKKRQLTPFGKKVVIASVKKNLELQEIARRVGISKQYLNLIIRGYRIGSRYEEKLKNVLNIKE